MASSRPGGGPKVRVLENRKLSVQARNAIFEALQKGQFEGGRMPPESELASMLGVSRTTVRAALQTLEHEGLIARTPGRGTVIERHATAFFLELQRLIGFSTMLRESGETPDVSVVWRKGQPLEESVPRLDIEPAQASYVSEKTFRTDKGVAIFLQDVVPAKTLTKSVATSRIPTSLFDFSEQFWVHPIGYAKVEMVPEITDETSARLLGIKTGEPFLTLLETHYSADSVPLAFSRVYVNDRFVRFFITRRH